MRQITITALIFILAASIAAQEPSCPAMQDEALANIAARCSEQEAGSLCIGFPTVSAIQRQPAVGQPRLQEPGDSIPLDGIDWFSLSTEDYGWGVARAVFPAYPPDRLEPESTALLAFGNVALFFPPPISPPTPLLDVAVTATRGAYLRAEPTTESSIVRPVAVRSKLKAVGASLNQGWLYVYAAPDLTGWMSAEVVSQPAQALPVLETDPASAPLWLPRQTFDFRSGMDDKPCAESLESGILLQTPKFIAPRRFVINGIPFLLSGSAWLQAKANSGTHFHLLDGLAGISAAGDEYEVKGGFKTVVPLEKTADGRIVPAGAPSEPVAYDYHALLGLPITLLIYPSRVRLDVYAVAEPVPAGGGSPLEGLTSDDDCIITAGLDGANIRSGPDPEASIIAVMAYRESAKPIARAIGSDSLPWWKLTESVWIRIDATSFGGNCDAVPLILPGD